MSATSVPKRERVVFVGLSGGVDSSVAAYLLKQQGYQVVGVFMQNWQASSQPGFCSQEADIKAASSVCACLQIPFRSVSFREAYWNRVFTHFLDEYAKGRTPNPDILCNKTIKFRAFLDYARKAGADSIATGHYARIVQSESGYSLHKAYDLNKDQSYFLHALDQAQLSQSLFPIGHLTKPKVRLIAKSQGFCNFDKKDSTGICFIGPRKFKAFLQNYLLNRPGAIETEEGACLGKHDGLMFYTIGQRTGLGIGGKKGAKSGAWYVIDKILKQRVLIVSQNRNHSKLLRTRLIGTDMHWIAKTSPNFPLRCRAKVRYRQTEADCVVYPTNPSTYTVVFDTPQWAITPGQSVVFYAGDRCLGGGCIAT